MEPVQNDIDTLVQSEPHRKALARWWAWRGTSLTLCELAVVGDPGSTTLRKQPYRDRPRVVGSAPEILPTPDSKRARLGIADAPDKWPSKEPPSVVRVDFGARSRANSLVTRDISASIYDSGMVQVCVRANPAKRVDLASSVSDWAAEVLKRGVELVPHLR